MISFNVTVVRDRLKNPLKNNIIGRIRTYHLLAALPLFYGMNLSHPSRPMWLKDNENHPRRPRGIQEDKTNVWDGPFFYAHCMAGLTGTATALGTVLTYRQTELSWRVSGQWWVVSDEWSSLITHSSARLELCMAERNSWVHELAKVLGLDLEFTPTIEYLYYSCSYI
jgi:hypothetical protein